MWKLLIVCLLPLVLSLPSEDREPRLGSLISNIFGSTQNQQQKPLIYIQTDEQQQTSYHSTEEPKTTCELKKGVTIGYKCYKYFASPLTYSAAVTKCIADNGKLWVPHIDEHGIWAKLFPFEDLFRATNQNVWIGVRRLSGVYTGTDGSIYTTNPLVLSSQNKVPECLTLAFPYGSFYLRGYTCTNVNDYVCEYSAH